MKTEMMITITLQEPYLNTLRKWASVQRTLNEAICICETVLSSIDERDNERINHCMRELEAIGPAINYLHQVARGAIWVEDTKP